jgi:hypothetical protein
MTMTSHAPASSPSLLDRTLAVTGCAVALVLTSAGLASADTPTAPVEAAPAKGSAPVASSAPGGATPVASAAPVAAASPAGSLVPESAAPAASATREQPAPLGISVSFTGSGQYQRVEDSAERTLVLLAGAEYTRPGGPTFFGRLGWVYDDRASASSLSNIQLGASMPFSLPRAFTLTARALTVLPVSTGGGNGADPGALSASLAATDWNGTMFSPNHLTIAAGARLAYAHQPLFAYADSSINQTFRVRGKEIDPIGPSVLFSSSKVVVGGNLSPMLSISGGASQTRYWGTVRFLGDDPAERDDYYVFAGLDATLELKGRQVRPGLLYARAVDVPKSRRDLQVIDVSVAVGF